MPSAASPRPPPARGWRRGRRAWGALVEADFVWLELGLLVLCMELAALLGGDHREDPAPRRPSQRHAHPTRPRRSPMHRVVSGLRRARVARGLGRPAGRAVAHLAMLLRTIEIRFTRPGCPPTCTAPRQPCLLVVRHAGSVSRAAAPARADLLGDAQRHELVAEVLLQLLELLLILRARAAAVQHTCVGRSLNDTTCLRAAVGLRARRRAAAGPCCSAPPSPRLERTGSRVRGGGSPFPRAP